MDIVVTSKGLGWHPEGVLFGPTPGSVPALTSP
jgi:hypothetical protein